MDRPADPTHRWQPAAAEQFSFWLGQWTVSCLDDDDREISGTNHIAWLYPSTVLQENFRLRLPGRPDYLGKSLSVPVPGRGWCQTWVDSAGNYLDFVGGWTGTTMILDRAHHQRGATAAHQRMIWRDITAHTLTWEWLGSDNTRDWQLKWRLHYHRR